MKHTSPAIASWRPLSVMVLNGFSSVPLFASFPLGLKRNSLWHLPEVQTTQQKPKSCMYLYYLALQSILVYLFILDSKQFRVQVVLCLPEIVNLLICSISMKIRSSSVYILYIVLQIFGRIFIFFQTNF